MNFKDNVVLVAGGTGGLGRAVSLAFLQNGAQVAVTYRNEVELQSLQAASGAHAESLAGFRVDVTESAQTVGLVDDIVKKWKQLDVLVNAVGGYAGGISLWNTDPDALEKMLSLNVRATFALAKAAVPAMLQRKTGAIVNVNAKAAWDHAAGASAYAASKAASLAMIDSLAADLAGTGVRVNSVLPSIIDTAANRLAMPGADSSKWPKPEDIARVILFLASDEARVIHGAAIPVFGI